MEGKIRRKMQLQKTRLQKQEENEAQNSLKKEKGITLVALVVTIVVLLILAGITITALFGDNGIIKSAQKAKKLTEDDQKNTQEGLQNLVNELNKYNGSTSTDTKWSKKEGTEDEFTNGAGATVKIGDYIKYDCDAGVTGADKLTCTSGSSTNGYGDQTFNIGNYKYGWRVLGVNEETGELLITSEDFVPTGSTTTGRSYYYLQGRTGYQNGEAELDRICSYYGQGTGATGGRSIDVEDINKITGYDPEHTGKNKNTGAGTDAGKCYAGQLYEYGNKVTYSWDGTEKPAYTSTNGKNGNLISHNNSSYGNAFYYYKDKEWTTVPYTTTAGAITDLTSNYYYYYPQTLTNSSNTNATTGIATNSNAYKMLFTNSESGAQASNKGTTSNFYYWLGSSYVRTSTDYAVFGMRCVYNGLVSNFNLAHSNGVENDINRGVRPVVSLKSNITLKKVEGETKDGCDVYDMNV